ncbi:hypothetical protein LCGC14_1730240 [marine sediment metagenome]|uniref:Uncharacterized protein n=1 Tax=marine sediment metagenome TaxID=412755 RepID=A0A0F9H9L0_9ZZZZ
MEVYTPGFNKIKELIMNEILKFIGQRLEASSRRINEFVLELKNEKIKEDRAFELIDFTYSSPYSSQVDDLLFDMVRRCIVKETRNGYKLTSHGLELVSSL